MGQIRLDRRGAKPQLIFLVGNGKKNIPKLAIELEDMELSTLEAAITSALVKLRPPTTSSGGV